jgi:hypothetical protein
VLVVVALATCPIVPALAETPDQYCARQGTDDRLQPIPADLVPAVNALFHTTMPRQVAIDTTVLRCLDAHVLVCTQGANLPCGKADTQRTTDGGTQWCRDHPDASFIPAYATGHATIFEWRCRGSVPEIARQLYEVDPRGFIAQYWKRLP